MKKLKFEYAMELLRIGYVVRNRDFEYVQMDGCLMCRAMNEHKWRYVWNIGDYEKILDWEVNLPPVSCNEPEPFKDISAEELLEALKRW